MMSELIAGTFYFVTMCTFSLSCFILFSYSFLASLLEKKNKPHRRKRDHGPRPQGNYTMFVEAFPPIPFYNKHLERED